MFFITEFKAVTEYTGEIDVYAGPNIEAISWDDAINYCREYTPWLEVVGVLESEIPCGYDYAPDYDNEIRYDNKN